MVQVQCQQCQNGYFTLKYINWLKYVIDVNQLENTNLQEANGII